MKKSIMFAFVSMGIFVNSAFADVGNGRLLTCGTPKNLEVFEIHKTAIVNVFQASYEGFQTDFKCLPVKINPRQNLNLTWRCIENRAGHGKVIVEVAQGGFTGASIANIFQEDGRSSLRYMGSLSCR